MESGLRVQTVDSGSPAAEMGVRPGDVCLRLNGRRVDDVLDFQFHYRQDEANTMLLARADGARWQAEFELDEGEGLGVTWADLEPRTCVNRCVFCFIDQLPPDVRPSLRVKDEDFRHSFLYGNFITLGNLSSRDLDRIASQRLSPLYVSVHATDPAVRARLVGCRGRDRFPERFERLVAAGIELHTQVVLCPGLNDGAVLERTLDDLAARRPAVQSVGVVPVGLTAHRVGLPALNPPDPHWCERVIDQLAARQRRFRADSGQGFVYLADEFYLQAGRPMPAAGAYDGYPQLENGIGLVRRWRAGLAGLLRRDGRVLSRRPTVVLTGRLFAPEMSAGLDRLNARHGTRLRAVPIDNRFLGSRVTVAGLLAGADLIDARQMVRPDEWVLLPPASLNPGLGRFLDDLTPADVAAALGVPVCVPPAGPEGLWLALSGRCPSVGPEPGVARTPGDPVRKKSVDRAGNPD